MMTTIQEALHFVDRRCFVGSGSRARLRPAATHDVVGRQRCVEVNLYQQSCSKEHAVNNMGTWRQAAVTSGFLQLGQNHYMTPHLIGLGSTKYYVSEYQIQVIWFT